MSYILDLTGISANEHLDSHDSNWTFETGGADIEADATATWLELSNVNGSQYALAGSAFTSQYVWAEIDGLLGSGGGGDAAYIEVWIRNSGVGDFYILQLKGDGTFSVFRIAGGAFDGTVYSGTPGITTDARYTHIIEVDEDGNGDPQFTLYEDDGTTVIHQVSDTHANAIVASGTANLVMQEDGGASVGNTRLYGLTLDGVNVQANSKSLTLTPNTATVSLDIDVGTDSKSLSLTTFQANVSAAVVVDTVTQSLTLTTHDATITAATNVQTESKTLTLTTYAATVSAAVEVETGTVSLTLTTYPAGISAAVNVQADSKTLEITTYPAGVALPVNVQTGTRTFTLQPFTATVVAATDVEVARASLVLTTYPVFIGEGRTVTFPSFVSEVDRISESLMGAAARTVPSFLQPTARTAESAVPASERELASYAGATTRTVETL